jgi:hypothetical protein
MNKRICSIATLLALGLTSAGAHATLILDQAVTESFNGDVDRVSTYGNDLSGVPSWLYLGQLRAAATGYVDFYYVGHEAGYTNSLLLDGTTADDTDDALDNFNAPYPPLGSLHVGAGELLDFGFCTSGGADIGYWDRCAHNDSAASLIAQFNYDQSRGYRSIAFRPLTSFDVSGSFAFRSLGDGMSDLWMVFWDDSGAANDDNHDDYVTVASFRSSPAKVPEPATALLLATGLLAAGHFRRRRTARQSGLPVAAAA